MATTCDKNPHRPCIDLNGSEGSIGKAAGWTHRHPRDDGVMTYPCNGRLTARRINPGNPTPEEEQAIFQRMRRFSSHAWEPR